MPRCGSKGGRESEGSELGEAGWAADVGAWQARLVVLESQYAELEDRQAAMHDEYRRVEKDRDDIYCSFEASVKVRQGGTSSSWVSFNRPTPLMT